MRGRRVDLATGLTLAAVAVMLTTGLAHAQSGSYLWDVLLAQDATFLKRVERAITQSAVNVKAESTATANHTHRAAWASTVLNNPTTTAALVAKAFVTQSPVAGTAVCSTSAGTCTTSATDAQMQTIADSLVNTYAVP